MLRIYVKNPPSPVEIVPDYYPVKYGLLYNWYAATDARGFTSAGDFVVPSIEDFSTLMLGLGGIDNGIDEILLESTVLKESGNIFWNTDDGTNETGFNARATGARTDAGLFVGLKSVAPFLSSSVFDTDYILMMNVIDSDPSYQNVVYSASVMLKTTGMMLRLVRPATAAEQLLADGMACAPYVGNDGKIYPTVKIGTQVWTAANSCETRFRNGNYIPFNECDDLHSFSNIEWANLETAGCCPYDNDWSNVPMAQPTGEACPALELTFDDIANVPVADASSVSDWNTFFDLPTNGSSFTSVEVVGDMIRLIGGSGITLKENLFDTNNNLISVNDIGNVVQHLGGQCFYYCDFLQSVIMNGVISIDYECFIECSVLTEVQFNSVETIGFASFRNLPVDTTINFPSLTTLHDGTSFEGCYAKNYIFPLLENIAAESFWGCLYMESLYIPNCLDLGGSEADNNTFYLITGQTITLTIPAALMTCNGGNPDGDIQYLQANNTVTIVTV